MRQKSPSTAQVIVLACLLFGLMLNLSGCSSDDGGGNPVVEPPPDLAAITDLTITAGTSTSVTIGWTSPPVLTKADLSITYDLRYTPISSINADWDNWTAVLPPPADTASGVARTHEVTGLASGARLAFDLRASGGARWSGASNLVIATVDPQFDTTPPAPVTDLRQWAGSSTSLTFAWTAARDDSAYGAVANHELRYAMTPIDDSNWQQALVATGTPQAGEVPGKLQLTVSGLATETTYYGAVVATDAAGNASGLSNVVSADTGDLNVIRVFVDGSGDYPTIIEAIHFARAGDLVLVGPGHYTWTNQATAEGAREMITVERDRADFEVRSMAGAEQTILDGEGNGAVMYITGGRETLPGGGFNYAGIILDGFTLTGGVSTGTPGNPDGDWAGGGIRVHMSDSTIRNCVFRGNEATNGGAVWIGGQGDATLEDCLIEDNKGYVGGGVMLINSAPLITVRRCTIRNNNSTLSGGGLFAYNCNMLMTDCVITGNKSQTRGGGVAVEEIDPNDPETPHRADIIRCTIVGNTALDHGAGVYLTLDSTLHLKSSVVAFNLDSPGLSSLVNSTLVIGCSLVFGNQGGDSLPFGAIDLGANLFTDPLFCDQISYRLQSNSPCLSANRSADGCGQIGARGEGCSGP